MTVNKVGACAPTPEALEELVLAEVLRDMPNADPAAVRLAIRKTLCALVIRQVASGDAKSFLRIADEETESH